MTTASQPLRTVYLDGDLKEGRYLGTFDEPAELFRLPDEPLVDNLSAAAERVDYRLSYEATDGPRRVHGYGIAGPQIRNAYYGRGLDDTDRPEFSSGDWEDPDHPAADAPEDQHIDAWFVTAVREAVHEALEWYWVDGKMFLSPHGTHEDAIHALSGEFARKLLVLRQPRPDGESGSESSEA